METITKLNSMQLFMLKMFNKELDVKQEKEIKQLLAEYFAKQIDQEMVDIWNSKGLSQSDLDNVLKSHNRTKYPN